jgi:hypothetical protein
VLGVRRWRELVIEKNGKVLLDRPKPTVDCSANGRRKRRKRRKKNQKRRRRIYTLLTSHCQHRPSCFGRCLPYGVAVCNFGHWTTNILMPKNFLSCPTGDFLMSILI